MLKLLLSIDKLPMNQSTPVMVRIINTGPGICTSINLTLDLPPNILIVDGAPHIRIARLEANEWHEHPLKIKARQQGTYYIKSANYSYTDARLQGCHPSEPLTTALEIIAGPPVVIPSQNSSRSTGEIPKGSAQSSQSASSRRKILFLAANPIDTPLLRLGKEVREIKEILKMAKFRDQFEIYPLEAVRTRDFRLAMLENRPNIVHFSGHGRHDGIFFEDETDHPKLVTGESLAEMFKLFEEVECVLLNACYSDIQANAIRRHVKYVIGMSNQIGDTAAREFSRGFYEALGAGYPIEFAFKFGCMTKNLENVPEQFLPVLKTRG